MTSSNTGKSKKPKNKGGRPPVEINIETLISLCNIQCTEVECAAVLKVDIDTINRRLKKMGEIGFAEFYKKHSAEGKASLRRMQWKAAQAGNITMMIWLGKQTLNQTDKQAIDHAGNVTVGPSYEAMRKAAAAVDKENA